ncbi:MAG: hypothetical protein K5770_20830 [Lachnospiraceae bacterium]|nr:hypothetical protein [Lachnospiraceae bacterium]
MDAVIYTKDDKEYSDLRAILNEEAAQMEIFRDPQDGHGHYEYGYDLVVVALEGAKGMNTVVEWSDRYPDTQVIWITGDGDFASVAFQKHISGFIVRPYEASMFRKTLREVLPQCPDRRVWRIRAGTAMSGKY